MMVVDASVWVSAITATDAHHIATTAWLADIRSSRSTATIPAHFPAEVLGVIRRTGAQPHTIRAELEWIFRGPLFEIAAIDHRLALHAAEVAHRAALRGSDAVYVALAASLDLPLVSWDRQQRERGALFCRTMTPVEAMEMTE